MNDRSQTKQLCGLQYIIIVIIIIGVVAVVLMFSIVIISPDPQNLLFLMGLYVLLCSGECSYLHLSKDHNADSAVYKNL